MTLGETISTFRKKAGLSQESLAERVGVSRQAVSKWELDEAVPEVDRLVLLAREFHITVDQLLSGQAPETATPAEPAPRPRDPEAPDNFDRTVGLFSRLVRRYGWLAGVYVALSGLGVTVVGALARWGFSGMYAASENILGNMGGMGSMGGWSYSGPPELEAEIMAQLGIAPAASPMSGLRGVFLGIPTVILVIGILTMIAGVVLALYLRKKGRES